MQVRSLAVLTLFAGAMCSQGVAQTPEPELHGAPLQALPSLALREDGPVLKQAVQANVPFTVAGPQGVVLGEQNGAFEAWVLPVKLLSHLTLEATIEGYGVPVDLNAVARQIEVRPDRTTITYSHIALTVKQIMFAPQQMPEGTGAVVLFEVDALKPVELTLRFTPEMREMWPKPSQGTASPEWVKRGESGFYVLHTDVPALAGAVALPGATSGGMVPYQERAQTRPLELHLRVAPGAMGKQVYPLLLAVGRTDTAATAAALEAKLHSLEEQLPALYAANAATWRSREATLTSIDTPDKKLNEDFLWAETSIEQLRARLQPSGELGLVAGYFSSGDSARPGFGWFFGRDALYTLYAVDSFGDFALSRAELEFLMRRQRPDGKMMHEYSQTAGEVNWSGFPYEYAAADATPLFLMAMRDYVQSSGDLGFLREHQEAVMKAWHFEETHDKDGDGIYDNAQGTGWVENWLPAMPDQEIYLALLDEQASRAMGALGELLGDAVTATEARTRSVRIHQTIQAEYYEPDHKTYAFSRNTGGVLDHSATVYPAIAWWDEGGGLDNAAAGLRLWSSHTFATDWGVRDLAATDAGYDSMSYHQGSVWPLFTGWQALAQYRSGHALAGYQSTMQNADLTQAQDVGAVTELLSGDFFVPFGRSTSHQLWSSAMVITPILRGMFGLQVNAAAHTLQVIPQLPAEWDRATLRRVAVGDSVVDVSFVRESKAMRVQLEHVTGVAVRLAAASGDGQTLRLALPAFEVGVRHGLPEPGARTTQMKILNEMHEARGLRLEMEGMAGSETLLLLRRNDARAHLEVEGAEVVGGELRVRFAAGSGYVAQTVELRW